MAGANLDDDDEITAINVTPLVDVTLVLLIIFMVTTSVISNSEGLQIAKPEAATGEKLDDSSVMLLCAADGTIEVDGVVMADDAAKGARLADLTVSVSFWPRDHPTRTKQIETAACMKRREMLTCESVAKNGIVG